MTRRDSLGPAAVAALLGVAMVAIAATANAEWVLPAGQEATVRSLLGQGAPVAGCTLERAEIAATAVVSHWRCAEVAAEVAAVVTLRRDPAAAGGVAVDAPAAPAALRDALQKAAADQGSALKWAEQAPAPAAATATQPEPKRLAHPDWPAGVEALYDETELMMRDGQTWQRIDRLMEAARQEPDSLVLGRLVVAAAERVGQADGPAWVDDLLARSDAQPLDTVLQFTAGVAVHYRGHTRGATLAAKRADYERAIVRLERVKQKYDHNARLWLYLAVSYLRTGRQPEARQAIDRAVAVDPGSDADVYYCRAEVWHRADPKRALADIERYQSQMKLNRAAGAWSGPGKEERVEAMRQYIQRVVDGKAQLPSAQEDLFDPLRPAAAREAMEPQPSPWLLWGGGLALVALVLAVFGWRRRNSSAG